MSEQENKSAEVEANSPETTSEPSTVASQEPTLSELDKANAALEEYKDKYLRTIAEFDNYKRRNAKERIELMQTAGREVIGELLEVLDDCDRAQKTLEGNPDAAPLVEGVLLVFNKLRHKLQARGLKAVDTLHQDFDADLHEAITEIPAPNEELKGKVIDEVVKGYSLNEKMIRHPKVVVGK
ncbi:MAG: nucleotide exchange factor GrpE [Chitinophagia bacterium]|nr:nucleotide exchange factor GrpE [Chitinophagia bacterium]